MNRTPNERSRPQPNDRRKPFQPGIGDEFEGIREVEAKSRGFLLRVVALTTAAGVIASGGYGLLTGDYTPVIAVWAAAGPFIGAMISYYFGPRRNDPG